LFKF